MLVFIHGYKGNVQDIEYGIKMLPEPEDVLVVAPESDIICENDATKKQWYSLLEYDPQNERRNPQSSVEKILEIYNKTSVSLNEVALKMNLFIDEMAKLHKILEKNIYIAGFSQGAMVAIYTALTRKQKVGGCIMMSGIVAGFEALEKEIKSRPNVLLIHGIEDISVQYKTHEFSKKWLKDQNIEVQSLVVDGLAHRMCRQGWEELAKFM